MLYNALDSLSNFYDQSFSVEVYYTFPDFRNYRYLDKYNIYEKFNHLFNLVESSYDK